MLPSVKVFLSGYIPEDGEKHGKEKRAKSMPCAIIVERGFFCEKESIVASARFVHDRRAVYDGACGGRRYGSKQRRRTD